MIKWDGEKTSKSFKLIYKSYRYIIKSHLRKKITHGVDRNKRGFAELYSRMKKRFFEITPTKIELKKDVELICKANGITNADAIIAHTNNCDNDFRVLKDLINADKNQ